MTEKLFYVDSHMITFSAVVKACENKGDYYEAVLDRTAFFPEGGGQYADTGIIDGVKVFDAQEKDGLIYHKMEGPLEVGKTVEGTIDWEERFSKMQNHSGEHIVSGLVHQMFGYDNVGFHMGKDAITMDFNGVLTKEDLKVIEQKANEAVAKNFDIEILYPSKEELSEIVYRSKIEIEGQVRIVRFPGYDVCACCAPHVHHTGEIGLVKIIGAMAHRGGMRLTILCGSRALSDYQTKQKSVEQISALLSAKQPEVATAVAKTKEDQQALIYRINDLQKMVLEAELKSLPAPDTTEDVFLFQKDLDTKAIRNAVNELCTRYTGYCGIFVGTDDTGYNFVLGSATKDCRTAAAILKDAYGAKCGGSERMIQGSVMATEKMIKGRIFN